jgi:hypothetical protein
MISFTNQFSQLSTIAGLSGALTVAGEWASGSMPWQTAIPALAGCVVACLLQDNTGKGPAVQQITAAVTDVVKVAPALISDVQQVLNIFKDGMHHQAAMTSAAVAAALPSRTTVTTTASSSTINPATGITSPGGGASGVLLPGIIGLLFLVGIGTTACAPQQAAALNDGLVCAATINTAVTGAPSTDTAAQKAAIATATAALTPSCQALPADTVAAMTTPKAPVTATPAP